MMMRIVSAIWKKPCHINQNYQKGTLNGFYQQFATECSIASFLKFERGAGVPPLRGGETPTPSCWWILTVRTRSPLAII